MKRITRRRFVAVAGTTSALAIAGCADEGPGEEEEPIDDEDDEEEEPIDDEEEDEDDENDEEEDEDDEDNGAEVEEVDVEEQPDDAAVAFVTPEDGDTVESPVEIEAEVEGIELEPAGPPAVGEGHLHLLVDHECFEEGEVIPGPSPDTEEEGIFHWSDGQSEDELELEPGEYDLCIQIGDGLHNAYGETDEISITVEE